MRIRHRIGDLPDGSGGYANATVYVRRLADSSTITTLSSDSNGWIDYAADGNPGPYYLYVTGLPGGDKFIRSDNVKTAGVLSLKELPVALRIIGDGVVRGYGDALAVTVGADTIGVASGAAVVAGHPVVAYSATTFPYSRPVSGVRTDRVILRLYPEGSATTPGKADLVILAGTIDAGAPSLTQTSTVYEISLASVAIPSAGAVTVTDERDFAYERPPRVTGLATSSSVTTSDAGGVALSGLATSLVLPEAKDYVVDATLTARQTSVASVTGWVPQATYGPTFNGLAMNAPRQVALNAAATRVYIADTANNRLVVLNGSGVYVSGITSLAGISGVCVDFADNIYTLSESGATLRLRKYTSALALQWTSDFGSAGGQRHVATDGTWVWATDAINRLVKRRLCTTGAGVDNFGSAGTGSGQFGNGGPYGITNDGSHLYASDPGNSRVQKFALDGSYVAQWASSDPHGLAVDSIGNIVVADFTGNVVRRYTNTGVAVDSFAQTAPSGIGVATGDVLWISNATAGTIAKWDEASTASGYGQVAVEIDANLGAYTGIGQREGSVATVHSQTVTGPATVVVRAFGKATSGTLTLASALLAASAKART